MRSPALLAPSLSPQILSDKDFESYLGQTWPELERLDRDPAPLDAWLGDRLKSPLLGRYFEALVGFWITHLLRARKFESSIVVSRDRRTLGELDFVFEGEDGLPWHWEVAVKFYLLKGRAPGEGLRSDAFWGAMTQDRLDKKLSVIFDRQLGMSRSMEGQEALLKAGFAQLPESRLLMKGVLFYPAFFEGSGDWRTALHPPEVSPAHWRGWWATEVPKNHGDPGGEAWTVLKRVQWLAPFWAPEDFVPLTHSEIKARVSAHFAQEVSPLMLACLERGTGGSWREMHRGLVMRPGWPQVI